MSVLPMSVAQAACGKLRMILDARATNVRCQYFKFAYETLSSILHHTRRGSYQYTLAFKAGYHHFSMAPQHWTYLGFALDGQLHVYACLPFGLSQAPQVFTRIMGVVYAALRQRDLHCAQMIDDVHGARDTYLQTWW